MTNVTRWLPIMISCLVFSGCQTASTTPGYIDTQLHLDGLMSADYLLAADYAVARMDDYGVAQSVLMPTPQLSTDQIGSYSDEALLPVIEQYPDRFIFVAGGGSLNPYLQAHTDAVITDTERSEFRAQAEELLAAGARGFGEIAALHLSLHDQHPYMAIAPDHELLLLLADIAAEHDVPIHLHMQAVEEAMSTPAAVLERSALNPIQLTPNIEAFERLLEHNPNTTIVWQHAGWDVTGQKTTTLLSRLLERHRNLYLSIRVAELESTSVVANRPLDETDTVRSDWVALITAYPDRFMIGADEFSGIPGQTPVRPKSLATTLRFVEQLPDEIQSQVGYGNAERLYTIQSTVKQ